MTRADVDYLIIHNSLTKDSRTVSWGAIRRYHTKVKSWSDIGYQFGIEQVGDRFEILVGRMLNEAGAHCRPRSGPYTNMNKKSWGICFVGNYNEDLPPVTMWSLGVKFVAALTEFAGIKIDNILGHGEVDSRRLYCPGRFFDMIRFREDVMVYRGLHNAM